MNEELKQDGTKRPHEAFTEATGYATKADAALAVVYSAHQFDADYVRASRALGEGVSASMTLADEVMRLRAVIAACEAQHTADVEAIRELRNALRDASEEPNIDRARAIADAVLCGKSHNARELSDGRTKTNPNT